MAKAIVKYNPAFLPEDDLIRGFVVRHSEFDLIMETVRENAGPSNQHVLVVGPRGSGKTTLALRVAAEIRNADDLKDRWYPLVFGEESYQVCTAGEFWLETLFHLHQQTKDPRWKKTYDELGGELDEGRLRERALGQLMDFVDSEGKRIMIVVENL
ncbi:MAG: ATP-binding protein, partial [Planctomycetes bacterium]|nr:ATP-binding protein [Planctomycetota bacterium]